MTQECTRLEIPPPAQATPPVPTRAPDRQVDSRRRRHMLCLIPRCSYIENRWHQSLLHRLRDRTRQEHRCHHSRCQRVHTRRAFRCRCSHCRLFVTIRNAVAVAVIGITRCGDLIATLIVEGTGTCVLIGVLPQRIELLTVAVSPF